jgi:hypothetical protein
VRRSEEKDGGQERAHRGKERARDGSRSRHFEDVTKWFV